MLNPRYCLLALTVGTSSLITFSALMATPQAAAQTTTTQPAPNETSSTPTLSFTQLMQIGYDATSRRDYQTALINFRRALELRPGNPYAQDAISNVWTYIHNDKLRQKLLPRLEQAMTNQDWRCSIEIVDRLIPTYSKTSVQRTQLITLKGELLGRLRSANQLNQQSNLCTDA